MADSGEDLLAFSDKSDYAINAELLVELQDDQDPSSLEGKDSPDGKGKLKLKRGIEAGHIFKLGTKYSESFNLKIQGDNENITPHMGCYGIGASRIVAAAIEQNHDEKGIIWPNSLSPYEVVIVEANPKSKENIKAKCEDIYNQLKENGVDVLWEDTDKRPGVKFADMELIGIPIMVIIGDKALENNQLELKARKDEKPVMVSHEDLLNAIKKLN